METRDKPNDKPPLPLGACACKKCGKEADFVEEVIGKDFSPMECFMLTCTSCRKSWCYCTSCGFPTFMSNNIHSHPNGNKHKRKHEEAFGEEATEVKERRDNGDAPNPTAEVVDIDNLPAADDTSVSQMETDEFMESVEIECGNVLSSLASTHEPNAGTTATMLAPTVDEDAPQPFPRSTQQEMSGS